MASSSGLLLAGGWRAIPSSVIELGNKSTCLYCWGASECRKTERIFALIRKLREVEVDKALICVHVQWFVGRLVGGTWVFAVITAMSICCFFPNKMY